MKKVLSILLIIILLGVFCVSTYLVADYIIQSRKQGQQFDQLSQMVDTN